MARTAEDHQGAHSPSGTLPHSRSKVNSRRPSIKA
jgi:hypothetical protein